MKIYKCDIRGCTEDAFRNDVDICSGYKMQTESQYGTTVYKPFEVPSFRKVDLCRRHLRQWCELTYQLYNGK